MENDNNRKGTMGTRTWEINPEVTPANASAQTDGAAATTAGTADVSGSVNASQSQVTAETPGAKTGDVLSAFTQAAEAINQPSGQSETSKPADENIAKTQGESAGQGEAGAKSEAGEQGQAVGKSETAGQPENAGQVETGKQSLASGKAEVAAPSEKATPKEAGGQAQAAPLNVSNPAVFPAPPVVPVPIAEVAAMNTAGMNSATLNTVGMNPAGVDAIAGNANAPLASANPSSASAENASDAAKIVSPEETSSRLTPSRSQSESVKEEAAESDVKIDSTSRYLPPRGTSHAIPNAPEASAAVPPAPVEPRTERFPQRASLFTTENKTERTGQTLEQNIASTTIPTGVNTGSHAAVKVDASDTPIAPTNVNTGSSQVGVATTPAAGAGLAATTGAAASPLAARTNGVGANTQPVGGLGANANQPANANEIPLWDEVESDTVAPKATQVNAQAASFFDDATVTPKPLPRTGAHIWSFFWGLILGPLSWFLVLDSGISLYHLQGGSMPKAMIIAELVCALITLWSLVMIARWSTLGLWVNSIITTTLGVICVFFPALAAKLFNPMLGGLHSTRDFAGTFMSGLPKALQTAFEFSMHSGLFLFWGLALLSLALGAHGARRAGRRDYVALKQREKRTQAKKNA